MKSRKWAFFCGFFAFFISIEMATSSWFMFHMPLTLTGVIVIIAWTLIGVGFGAYCDKHLTK